MRSKMFRGVAGVLAVLLIGVVALTDLGNGPITEVIMFVLIGCMFGVYAVLGEAAVNKLIGVKTVEIRHPDDR